MSEDKKNIYCIGGANIDYKLKSIHPLEMATSNPATAMTTFGGVARNVCENLSTLTSCVYLQTAVGNDSEGQHLLQHLQNKNINIDHCLVLERETTSRYYAVLDQSGELYIALSAMDIYERIPTDRFIQSCEWQDHSIVFIDTNLSTAIIESIIQLAQIKKCILCIDPVSAHKARKLPQSLEGVFLIKPDQHEACVLTNQPLSSIEDYLQAGQLLLNRGVKNVVITLGNKGYVIVNENIQRHFSGKKLDTVIDVSGAGDAFFAGILYGLQNDIDIEQACRSGEDMATHTVQSYQTVVQSSLQQKEEFTTN